MSSQSRPSVTLALTKHDVAPGIIRDASKVEIDNAAGREQAHVAHPISHGDGVSVFLMSTVYIKNIQSVALKVDVDNAAGHEQAKMAHTILHGDGISVRGSSTEHDIAPGIIGDASKMELDNAAGREQVHVAHAISHGDGVSVQSSLS